jgi:hypothetical protein
MWTTALWLRLGCAGSTLEPDRAVMDEKHQTKFPKKEATIVVRIVPEASGGLTALKNSVL